MSPTLFKIVVNNVLRNFISMMVEEKLVACGGMGIAVGWYMGIFYANGVLVG